MHDNSTKDSTPDVSTKDIQQTDIYIYIYDMMMKICVHVYVYIYICAFIN